MKKQTKATNKKKAIQPKKVINVLNEPRKILKVHASTHARLSKIGDKSETFDSIVRMLLDRYESNK